MKPRSNQKGRHTISNPTHQVGAERIQERAYQLYLYRGQEPGHELEDWLRAEHELQGQDEQRYAG